MTIEKIIALAKEKLGKDITEQEAKDFLSGKASLPDEALDIVSGGANCTHTCPNCGESNIQYSVNNQKLICSRCGYDQKIDIDNMDEWRKLYCQSNK